MRRALLTRGDLGRGAVEGGEVLGEEGSQVAQGEVSRGGEAEFHLVAGVVVVSSDGPFDAQLGDAAEGEGAARAGEDEVDASGALGVDRGPGATLAGKHEVDDFLVVPEELGAGVGGSIGRAPGS